MSHLIYMQSKAIMAGEGEVDPSFYAIIMAAMRKADTRNLRHLKAAFPGVWNELQERYVAPGGFLSMEEAIKLSKGEYTRPMLDGVQFPREGWPTDEYP